MKFLDYLHNKWVYNHRMNCLIQLITESLTLGEKVLDIGCGDGKIAYLISQKMPLANLEGLDLFVRKETHIKVTAFDGIVIPFDDNSFNTSMLIDVLHHTDNPIELLMEATRVSKDFVIIKDHIKDGFLSAHILKLMDYVGNASREVRLPYNYFTQAEWTKLFIEACLEPVLYKKQLKLYPFPINFLFDRNLHFFAKLKIININI